MKTLKLVAYSILLILSTYALADSIFYSFYIGTAIAVSCMVIAAFKLSSIK